MKIGRGTVKKYSREYVRTLKDGRKKKYKTEQIQVTIPKQEDIYTNGEEVLIIPLSEKDQIEESSEIITSLEIFNSFLNEELNNLKHESKEKDLLIKELNQLRNESEEKDLKIKELSQLKNEVKEKDLLIKELDQLKDEVKEKDLLIKELSSNQKTIKDEDYDNLKEDYNELVESYYKLENDLCSLKNSEEYSNYLARRFKDFILKTE